MNKTPIAAALFGATLAGAALAAEPTADRSTWTVKQINECASNNLVGKGALRDLTVMPYDREGKSRTLKMRFFWKPTARGEPRVNLRLTEPLPVAGSAYLMTIKNLQEDVYFYFPGADRALKITGKNMSEPMWGTDVSYGEIKQVLGVVATTDATRVADAKVGERDAFVLEVTSDPNDGYSKVVSYIEHKSCVLLKAEFFDQNDQPRKRLLADQSKILEAENYWLSLGYTMEDLSRGTKTVLDLSDFSIDERLPERLFDPQRFFEPYN